MLLITLFYYLKCYKLFFFQIIILKEAEVIMVSLD
jgi:hypothetical protein